MGVFLRLHHQPGASQGVLPTYVGVFPCGDLDQSKPKVVLPTYVGVFLRLSCLILMHPGVLPTYVGVFLEQWIDAERELLALPTHVGVFLLVLNFMLVDSIVLPTYVGVIKIHFIWVIHYYIFMKIFPIKKRLIIASFSTYKNLAISGIFLIQNSLKAFSANGLIPYFFLYKLQIAFHF